MLEPLSMVSLRKSTFVLGLLAACHRDASDEVAEHEHDQESDVDEPVDCDAAIVPVLELGVRRVDDVRRAGDATIVMSRGAANTTRITATQGCGLPSRTIADALSYVAPAPRADLPWFVVDATDQRWLADPIGGRSPHHIAMDRPQLAAWSTRGAVVVDEGDDSGARALVELAMDSTGRVRRRVLPVEVGDGGFTTPSGISDSLALTTTAGNVVVVELATGALAPIGDEHDLVWTLDDEARCFVVSSDPARGRDLRVFDRNTATNVAIGRPEWLDVAWEGLPGVVQAVQGPTGDAPAETQLVLVPELRELWWPAAGLYDGSVRARDGARLFVQDDVVLWLAPDSDAPVHLDLGLDGAAIDRIELFAFDDELVIAARGRPDERGVILTRWYRPLPSGAGVEALFDHPVWGAFRVDEDRWAYFDGATDNHDWRGELLLQRRSTGTRWAIRKNVRNQLAALGGRIDMPERDAVRNELLFVEADDAGQATLWLARPDQLQ